jgi:hypothetical protein
MGNLDFKTILMGIVASLSGYVFYGYIELKAEVNVVKTQLEQSQSELRDLWSKYNAQLDKEVNFITKFYEFQKKEQADKDQLKEELLEFKIQYEREKK